jgi:hypothetical protein
VPYRDKKVVPVSLCVFRAPLLHCLIIRNVLPDDCLPDSNGTALSATPALHDLGRQLHGQALVSWQASQKLTRLVLGVHDTN